MKSLDSALPSDEWVKERSNYIGGSDVGTILGENPYSTPLQLWLRKNGALPPIEETPILRFGHFFEQILSIHFEETTGLKTRQVNKTYEHSTYAFLRANIDRMVLADPEKGLSTTAVLELKTTTSHRLKALGGEYPKEWILQVQHYLGITGYSKAYLQCYERDTCKFHDPVLIERDDNLIAENMGKLIAWWDTHMVNGKRPAPINGEDRLILYPNSYDGKTVEATPAVYSLYTELKTIRERKADLEKMEEYLKVRIQDKLQSGERLVCGGKTLVSWKSSSQNRLDMASFKEAHPKLYQQYLKETKTRRFTVH
ncbi:MAG: YqaJ viral recombinase family protein [Balneola sp.]|nr:YqaJ viral recombinase family protein [Balneola sp.]